MIRSTVRKAILEPTRGLVHLVEERLVFIGARRVFFHCVT